MFSGKSFSKVKYNFQVSRDQMLRQSLIDCPCHDVLRNINKQQGVMPRFFFVYKVNIFKLFRIFIILNQNSQGGKTLAVVRYKT